MPEKALRAIYRINLGVRPIERVLVFTDRPAPREALAPGEALRRERLREITKMAVVAGRGLCREVVFVEYPATGVHGKEPPYELWEAAFGPEAVGELTGAGLMGPILEKRIGREGLLEAEMLVIRRKAEAVDAVLALANYSTSHTSFRQFLTGLCGARYASMPLFDETMLTGAMDVDWLELERRTRAIAKVVDRATGVEMNTPEGTEISFSTLGRRAEADTGIITRAGSFGNLPAGEVYLAPCEGTAEGRLVLLWAPTRRLASPVTLDVRGGMVTDVTGGEPFASELAARLGEREENRNIAEFGIGTNPRAKRPDNILESEKILGTVHMALGDNSSFGGKVKAPFHQDFVFFSPSVTLKTAEGESIALLRDGQPADIIK